MNWPTRALFAVTLLAAVGTGLHSRAQTQNQPPSSARSRSDEMVDRWHDIGEGENPTRDAFKTKADVVKFVQEAVADGAKVIQQQGDAGLDNTTKFFGNRMAHNSSIWTFAIEHSGE